MSTSSGPHAGLDVVADINYFPALGYPISTSAWRRRYLGASDEHTRAMNIRDVRGSSKPFALDTHGFEFVKLQSETLVSSADDEAAIKREYYPILERLILDVTGASTAHVFNHVIRAHSSPSDKGVLDAKGRWQDIPAGHPHVDYSGDLDHIEGTKRELSLPPHISKLLDSSSRFAFLGAWRPLKTLRKDPLAVCDATTVPDSDYQVRLREFRSGVRSGNYVMSHGNKEKQHMWYYMSDMEPDDMVVFKGYDTKRDKPGWRCPHTAFILPGAEEEPPRESIEARIVCFWE
ncbi:hypothetical protein BDV96DRAFT_500560 [Lophiotrema nucula]|uniref:GA4 desaturase family protein n=1 Tax=Lophiotrema nucula TaxID=690887 RepID=A0A6A5YV26_9PLEO|nr:hypothetical protein BDV96DRAFT_500560 [Lophiotrema nucula]